MKQAFIGLVLLCSIGQAIFAQQSNGPVFKVPGNYNYAHKLRLDLGKSNSVTIYLADINDVPRIVSVDSLIRRFLIDLAPLKDSLNDPLAQYYVDHFSDALGVRKIGFRKRKEDASSYLVMDKELASLKLKQDTVRLSGIIPHPDAASSQKNGKQKTRYYEFVFSLNNIDDLNNYMDGSIGEKLTFFARNKNSKWIRNWEGGLYRKLSGEPSITADRRGAEAYNSRDFLSFQLFVSIQNYKNYFAPGFGAGVTATFSNYNRTWKHMVGLYWEPSYLFAKDDQDKLKTYRNDFLTLSYAQGPVEDKDPQKGTWVSGVGSLGYLIYQKGDFIEKNTFRLSFGRFNWHKTSVDPTIYFNDFFRGVTPGLRVIQRF